MRRPDPLGVCHSLREAKDHHIVAYVVRGADSVIRRRMS
jgi:hypothetical protein